MPRTAAVGPKPGVEPAALPEDVLRWEKFEVTMHRWSTLSAAQQAAVFDLCKSNMAAMYDTANFGSREGGWSDDVKRKELAHRRARFLLASAAAAPAEQLPATSQLQAAERPVVGFAHFRLERVDERTLSASARPADMVYLYELQTAAAWQSRGLGTFLLEALLRAAQAGCPRVTRVSCTCLTINEGALRFYRRAGFVRDAHSPPDHEGCGYEILTKILPPPAAPP